MKRYEFDITIAGNGNDVDEAWNNAVEAFSEDPGVTPDDWSEEEIEDDEDESDLDYYDYEDEEFEDED